MIFGSNRRFFVRRSVGERMIFANVIRTMKHGGGGVTVCGCFGGDTVCDIFIIQGTLNQHGYQSILQLYAIPSGLRLGWLCKGYLTKKESDGAASGDLAST